MQILTKNDPIPADAKTVTYKGDDVFVYFADDSAVIKSDSARAAVVESDRKNKIKKKAAVAIEKIAPYWRQANDNASAWAILEKQVNGLELTADDLAELDRIKGIRTAIDAIRAASDQAEADGTLPDDFNP